MALNIIKDFIEKKLKTFIYINGIIKKKAEKLVENSINTPMSDMLNSEDDQGYQS